MFTMSSKELGTKAHYLVPCAMAPCMGYLAYSIHYGSMFNSKVLMMNAHTHRHSVFVCAHVSNTALILYIEADE